MPDDMPPESPREPQRESPGREPGPAPRAGAGTVEWERDLLSRLAFAAITEQRRARRWNILFKVGILVYLVVVLFLAFPGGWMDLGDGKQHTALVDVKGVIAAGTDASADRIIGGLRAAFEDENTAGVIVRINSPGGSPVQAGYVNDEIRRLREKHPDTPLYAVIADVCASGGYYIAAAADRIYADKASIVGSIGVLMNGFGFVEAMEKVGVERRLFTAGANKGLLDAFSPLRDDEVAHVRSMLDDIHTQFKDVVRRGRGDRIKSGADLYSGLIWTGQQSLELGLVDELGSASYVAREVIGADEVVNYTPRRGLLDSLAKRIGAAMGESLAVQAGLGGFELR